MGRCGLVGGWVRQNYGYQRRPAKLDHEVAKIGNKLRLSNVKLKLQLQSCMWTIWIICSLSFCCSLSLCSVHPSISIFVSLCLFQSLGQADLVYTEHVDEIVVVVVNVVVVALLVVTDSFI